MNFIVENWELLTIAFLVLDKVVAITPTKYDDIILTTIKAACGQVMQAKTKKKGL